MFFVYKSNILLKSNKMTTVNGITYINNKIAPVRIMPLSKQSCIRAYIIQMHSLERSVSLVVVSLDRGVSLDDSVGGGVSVSLGVSLNGSVSLGGGVSLVGVSESLGGDGAVSVSLVGVSVSLVGGVSVVSLTGDESWLMLGE